MGGLEGAGAAPAAVGGRETNAFSSLPLFTGFVLILETVLLRTTARVAHCFLFLCFLLVRVTLLNLHPVAMPRVGLVLQYQLLH